LRVWTPLGHGSRYYDSRRRVVERVGLRYGTRLSGYMAPDHPRRQVPIFLSQTLVCWTHKTIVLNTKVPVTKWWAMQAYDTGPG
jgi:hypothetical protein